MWIVSFIIGTIKYDAAERKGKAKDTRSEEILDPITLTAVVQG